MCISLEPLQNISMKKLKTSSSDLLRGGLWSEDGKKAAVIEEILTQINEHTGEQLAEKVKSKFEN